MCTGDVSVGDVTAAVPSAWSSMLRSASQLPSACPPADHGHPSLHADSDAEEQAPRKLPRLGSQQQRQARKAQAAQRPESHPM